MDTEGNNKFEKEWDALKKFEHDRRPQSALDIAYEIFTDAQNSGDIINTVKSLLYVMQYRIEQPNAEKPLANVTIPASIAENKNLYQDLILATEIEALANESENKILSSLFYYLSGHLFETHLSSAYYDIRANNISSSPEYNSEDIKFWNEKQYHDKIVDLYSKSLNNDIKQVNIDQIEPFLSRYNSKLSNFDKLLLIECSPTMYDLISYAILEYFSNDRLDKFCCFSDPKMFESNKNFAQIDIQENNEWISVINPFKILQNLVKLHLESNNLSALDYLAVQRYKFLTENKYLNNDFYEKQEQLLQSIFDNAQKNTNMYGIIAAMFAEHYLSKNTNVKYTTKAIYDILQNALSLCPQNSSGYYQCSSFIENIKKISFDFSIDSVLIPDKPNLMHVSYCNLDKVYYKVYTVDKNFYTLSEYYANSAHFVWKIVDTQTPAKEWTQELYDDKEFCTFSSDVVMPALPVGHYLIVASDKQDLRNIPNRDKEGHLFFTKVTSTHFAIIERQVDHYQERNLYIVDRETGLPLKNVEVVAKYSSGSKKNQVIDTFHSDENGYVHIDYTKYMGQPKENKNFAQKLISSFKPKSDQKTFDDLNLRGTSFELTLGDDNIIAGGDINRHFYDDWNSVKSVDFRVEFMLDRVTYRPGQKVYFKTILYNNDEKKVVAGKNITIKVRDPNREVFFTTDLTTNSFGSVNGEFVIPTDRLNGQFEIFCEYYNGSKLFKVEEYKRPKFEVKFKPIEGLVKLENEVAVKGVALSYAGIPIQNANVAYKVSREENIPYWSIWRNRSTDNEVVESGNVVTDKDGIFTIKFVPEGKFVADEIGYFFTIDANVTDINGETQSAKTTVNIGGVAIDVHFGISDMIYQEQDLNFKIVTTNTEGADIPNKGQITISKLKTPDVYKVPTKFATVTHDLIGEQKYREIFPHFSYMNEHLPENMAVEKKCLTINYDTGKSKNIDLSELKKFGIGQYSAQINTKDQFGKQITITKYFILNDDSDKLPVPSVQYHQVNDKNTNPGDKVTFDIGSSAEITVLVEKERQDKIISSQLLRWTGRKKFVFDIDQADCGGVTFHFTYVLGGRMYSYSKNVFVEYVHKQLDISVKTMRNVMEPNENGTVELLIKDYKGNNVSAEVIASMYDASMNVFGKNYWGLNPYRYYGSHDISGYYFQWAKIEKINNIYKGYYQVNYLNLPFFGWYPYQFTVPLVQRRFDCCEMTAMGRGANFSKMQFSMSAGREDVYYEESAMMMESNGLDLKKENDSSEEVYIRKNLAETAFFSPQLCTDENGEVVVKFTMPDSLTTWDFMAFAHTPDLARAFIQKEIISQKTVMVTTNIMRFLREKDQAVLSAKVSNLSEQVLNGVVEIQLFDASTNQKLDIVTDKTQKSISLDAKGQASVQWSINVPDGIAGITYRIVAKAGKYSDGEEATVPVLPRRMLVTEAVALSTKKQETKTYNFDKLVNLDKNSSITTQKMSVEYTANPAWTALMSLPYLVEYPYDCMEQTFSKIYGNALALHLIKNNPKLAEMIKNDKSEPESMLEKNEDLKNILLAESPWVCIAKGEKKVFSEVKQFLDYPKVEAQIRKLISILEQGQLSNGAWPWFIGGKESFGITFHIVKEYGHLKKLGVDFGAEESTLEKMIKKAVYFCDDTLSKEYKYIKKNYPEYLKENHLPGFGVDYLYARSFFDNYPIRLGDKEAYNYFWKQAHTYWNTLNEIDEAKLMQVFCRKNDTLADKLLIALKEQGVVDEEFGFYWHKITGMGKASAIEAQALMIEAFCEVEPSYEKIKDMQVWLLKQKQTNDWYTTKATTNAIYGLLLNNVESITVRNEVDIAVGKNIVSTKNADNSSGYIRQDFDGTEVCADMGKITLTNHSDNLSWGGVFWQYYNDLDKIENNGNSQMRIKKQYIFATPQGKVKSPNEQINVGDIVTVRLQITSDREYSFVHLKDSRPACLEPLDCSSGYVFDKLFYYKSVKDASVNFFIDDLTKGSFVIDYKLRVANPGKYLSGMSTIQCMYAPEFVAHSDGGYIEVK